jgi:hypothetical protein
MEEDETKIEDTEADGDDWDDLDDGQPTEAQEWHDYDSEC